MTHDAETTVHGKKGVRFDMMEETNETNPRGIPAPRAFKVSVPFFIFMLDGGLVGTPGA